MTCSIGLGSLGRNQAGRNVSLHILYLFLWMLEALTQLLLCSQLLVLQLALYIVLCKCIAHLNANNLLITLIKNAFL